MCYEQDFKFMVCNVGYLNIWWIDASISQESTALVNFPYEDGGSRLFSNDIMCVPNHRHHVPP